MTIITDYSEQRALTVWRACLASAFRATLACTIVAAVTLYSPEAIQRQVALPAFSYVTVILIITDATLGDTLRGCWLALYATMQSVGPAILSLWLIGPTRLSSGITALAVALAAFVVVLPENTHLVAKRIALGQIVLIYVVGYIEKEEIDAVMHPVHVAASTAVGVFACVLALLLPFPRLAVHEVKENWEHLAENASDRVQLHVKACCAEDKTTAQSVACRAKCLAHAGNKFLQNIKRFHGSIQWEQLPFKSWKFHVVSQEKLQELDLHLRGMEIALTNTSFPLKLPNEALQDDLHLLEGQLCHKIKQSKCPQASSMEKTNPFQSLYTTPISPSQLPFLFFVFCMKSLSSLYDDNTCDDSDSGPKGTNTFNYGLSFRGIWSTKRLVPALKCSLSLGLAVLFGLIYSRPDGYWAGLPVAISLASSREATFKVANVKAQGTVLGTVYGVVGMFLFEKFLPIRFFSLIPWFIFTSFLRNSKMYGQAGGVSAIIGAVLILGRKDFGPPSEFAIARIVETFIGLSCAILVELLMRPTRGATLAKQELVKSFGVLIECVNSFNLHDDRTNFGKTLKNLRQHLNELGTYVGEANMEPNFWFVPFNSNCYGKLLVSLSQIVDVLHFGDLTLKSLEQMSQKLDLDFCSTKEVLANKIDNDIKLFQDAVGSSIRCFQEVMSMKSLPALEKRIEEEKITWDIEKGKNANARETVGSCGSKDDGHEKSMSSYLQHSQELIDKLNSEKSDKDKDLVGSEMASNLCTLGYSLSKLIKETREIENCVRELIQWENPSSYVDLYEICCKIHALQN